MTQSDREAAHVARARQTHDAVLQIMASEKPGMNMFTWRDRYLDLFRTLWERQQPSFPLDRTG
jgi:hypothetical protein